MKTFLIILAIASATIASVEAQSLAPTPVPTTTPVQLYVEFHIPAGTGGNPWNTEATAVQAKLGQVIRIFNDDGISHRLHTADGAPCNHGPDFAPGTSFDCVVGKAFTGARYDHNFGPSAAFWINAK